MGTSFIPRKDADFAPWAKVFNHYFVLNHERFGIHSTVLVDVDMAFMKWEEKYAVTESAATRTPAAIREKNEARAAFELQVRRVNNEYLAYNSRVTDADREAMGLHIPKKGRTPQPVPSTMPEFYVDTSLMRRLVIHFRDLGSSSRAKPAGVHGAEIKWGFADAKPGKIDELANSSFDTRSPHALDFSEEQRGKTVWLCLRWENTRGEKGPWSEIKASVIP